MNTRHQIELRSTSPVLVASAGRVADCPSPTINELLVSASCKET